jgi:hypothetical protein
MSKNYLLIFFMVLAIGQSQDWDVSLAIVNDTGSSFEIYMINNVDIAGFQIQFPDLENFVIESIGGGLMEENGFLTSFSDITDMIMGFSMIGTVVAAGEGVLLNVGYSGTMEDVEIITGECGGSDITIFSDVASGCLIVEAYT